MPTDLERWFRAVPDSSVLARPRLLARSLIAAADLDERIAFYQQLLGVPMDLRMPIPDFGGLELAAVGGLLIIASERPFTPIQRRTAYSLIVPSLPDALERLAALDGSVLEPPETIMPGARARVCYPDGLVAELVEHRPRPGEQPRPAAGAPRPELPEHPAAMRLLARRTVPRAGLRAALAFYTAALEAPAEFLRPASPDGSGLAMIGNLVLVASADGSDDPVGPAIALLAGTPQQAAPGEFSSQLMTLPDGQRAEVWGAPEQLAAISKTVR